MKRYPYTKLLLCSMLLVVSVYGVTRVFGMQSEKTGQDAVSDSGMELPEEEFTLLESGTLESEPMESEPMESEPIRVEVLPTEESNQNLVEESTETPNEQIPATVDLLQDTLFIGDSRTVGLMEYGDLGEAEVFSDTGMSVFKVMEDSVKVRSGGKKTLQEVLQGQQFGKVYIMLGLNELGYPFNSILSKYQELIAMVRQYQPDALIFLEANLHVSAKRSESSDVYNNAKINQLNEGIRQMADNETIFYLDINPVFDDAGGNLDSTYTVDDSHVLGKYYDDWSRWIVEQTAEILSRGAGA